MPASITIELFLEVDKVCYDGVFNPLVSLSPLINVVPPEVGDSAILDSSKVLP